MFWRATSTIRRRLDGAVQVQQRGRLVRSARAARGPQAPRPERHDGRELPAAEPIATVPRTLKQAGLLELEEAASDPEIT